MSKKTKPISRKDLEMFIRENAVQIVDGIGDKIQEYRDKIKLLLATKKILLKQLERERNERRLDIS